MADLDTVTVAFDLDNTLLDPTGARYDAITSEFLSQYDLGLDADSARDAYELVRRWGPVLAQLGFANVLHDRGHVDGLALLVLLFSERKEPETGVVDTRVDRTETIALLDELENAARHTRRGAPQERLQARRLLQSLLSTQRATALRDAVSAVSEQPRLVQWSHSYDTIENAHAADNVYSMLADLIGRGATCVVISQGQSTFQRKKIRRLGLDRLLSGRVLITQDARQVDGFEMLDTRIDSMLAEERADGSLDSLWTYRCLLDVWGSKSPWFYARCLHALHPGGGNVEKRLASIAVVDRKEWTTRPFHLVMIGDRYEKDILPLIDLLGPGVVQTIHLCTGKYNDNFSTADLPEYTHPTRSFKSMSALRRFLETELSAARIAPVKTPPAIVPDGWFDRCTIEFGAASDLECVRNIAKAIHAAQR